MASNHAEPGLLDRTSASSELGEDWRRLTRRATAIALITSPAPFVWFHSVQDYSLGWSLFATAVVVIAFRGLIDLATRRLMPWPSLYGTDDATLKEEDVIARRRVSFWRFWLKVAVFIFVVFTAIWVVRLLVPGGSTSWVESTTAVWDAFLAWVTGQQLIGLMLTLPLFLVFNAVIFLGPLLLIGITQMRGFEPGDADWGVRLGDVRGQDEAKEEVSRVVTLWQSGEAFEKAGGKRERGLLFLGAPGTGKTMLAKAIATGFNCPIVMMPGSGFQQTFIGMDAVIVRLLARKAKKLARKWGGQCIVFIDEIDAVGMRRSALQGGAAGGGRYTGGRPEEDLFYGPWGALNPSGDMILETRAWRDRLFAERAQKPEPSVVGRILNQGAMPGMFGGGQLALNQLLVVMDGIDNPPFFRRLFTNWTNTLLDATYFIPSRAGRTRLRLPRPKPRKDQIYFIGATNVPMNALDPALTRPGRMGRHVWLRTPQKQDRQDIFDLYINKVAHTPELDTDKKRDELARITSGYSPAMIEQVCSMALTYAHAEGREVFDYSDILEAMTTVESGTAVNIEYPPEDTKAVAIHEAGHAAASHAYMKDTESTRISIRMRGEALGHHQAAEQVERFSSWRSDQMANLIWALGALAAERVFYGQTSTGVGGDVASATQMAALMVGAAAMGPEPLDLDEGLDAKEEARVLKRFEGIGLQLMNRTGNTYAHDVVASVLSDPDKRRLTAQILGQAYVTAHNFVKANQSGVEKIADEVVERREIYGDELLDLLKNAKLTKPRIDLLEEASWPTL
ncbi:MAG TPA: AAA family ATPase [Gaiellaceae bacterium]|nr:AAA family ATPase [Gaiellaceae bacterium]